MNEMGWVASIQRPPYCRMQMTVPNLALPIHCGSQFHLHTEETPSEGLSYVPILLKKLNFKLKRLTSLYVCILIRCSDE